MIELITKLATAWGPAGFEHQVRDLIRAEVADLADEMRVDAMGNLICRIGDGPTRIMTAAHMDEIGLIVGHIDRNGFLRFATLGYLFPGNLHGSRVKFENGTIGTIGAEEYLTKMRSANSDGDKFYIDVSTGDVSTGGGEESPVKVGDPAAFVADVVVRGQRVAAKSMDDRIGCAVQIEAMRRVKAQGTPHSVYFVFTVQEEVGVRGATTSAFGIEPHLGFAIDVCSTGDAPNDLKMDVALGKGVAIKARDAAHIVPPAVLALMRQRADENSIPHQTEVMIVGGTDAAAIQMSRAGVPSGTLSIPCRYVHSPSETVDLRDVEAAVALLTAIVCGDLPESLAAK